MIRYTIDTVIKKILIDIAGFSMLLGALAFGWLPGPGGMPLLLGGLGLLSINHEWARKLLHTIKEKGTSLYTIFFPNNKKIHWLYDIVGLIIGSIAIYTITLETKNLTQSLAIAVVFVCLGLLLTNRRRLENISATVNRLSKRNKHKQ
jgi:sulfite exporter TauE/SafE